MSRKKKAGRLGSSFSDYLKSAGSYDETSAVAVKRVLARSEEHTSELQSPI